MKKTAIATIVIACLGGGCSPDRPTSASEPASSVALGEVEPVVQDAVRSLLEQIATSPQDAELRMELAMLYHACGLADAVELAYTQALDLAPTNAKGWYLLALHRNAEADIHGALNACRETVRLAPGNSAARRKLGDLLLDLGEPEGALEAFEQASGHEPEHPANLVGQARAHLQLHHWAQAAGLLETVIATQDGYGYAYMLLGRAYLGMGEREKARVASSRGAGTVPPFFDPWAQELLTHRIGYSGTMAEATKLFRERDNEGVIRVLSKLREQYPDDALLLNNLASAYSRMDRIDEMLATLQHAVAAHPEHYSTHLNLSYAYSGKENLVKALEHAQHAILLRPTQGPALAQLCSIYADMGDHERARRSIEAAIEFQGNRLALRMRLGKLLFEMELFEEAAESLSGLTTLYPSSIKGFQLLARSLMAIGRLEEAAAALTAAKRLNPDHRSNAEISRLLREQIEQDSSESSATKASD
ncbi:MAG: tetratricopeptide (TPR) repeat protein [Chlamydiales bacterium]|jgi:tetratricopeptide (TPR) repeat protein